MKLVMSVIVSLLLGPFLNAQQAKPANRRGVVPRLVSFFRESAG